MKRWSSLVLVAVILIGLVGVILTRPKKERLAEEVKPEIKTKRLALTFDADMTPLMKKRLLNKQVENYDNQKLVLLLEKERVKATLFLTGMWTEVYATEAAGLAKNNLFEIGNHSYSHPGFRWPCYTLAPVSEEGKKTEIERAQTVIEKITGIRPKLWRFPGGCADGNDKRLVEGYGLKVVGWDIASGDAFNNSAASIERRVLAKARDGAIIVFHLGGPNAPKTEEALEKIIPKLRENGYQFVKVSEL